MKLHHVVCAGLLMLGAGHVAIELRAASNRQAILSNPQMQSMTAVPLFGDDGKLQSLHVTAQYLVLSLHPDGKTKQKHLTSVDIDVVVQAKQQVIVSDEIVTLGDLGDDLMTLADAIWFQRFPPPLPVPRRRALREPLQQP